MGVKDPKGRGVLFRDFVRILKEKQPKAFLLENVRGLFLHEDGNTHSCPRARGIWLRCEIRMLDAVKLLPQERCRLFLVGIRTDLKKEQPFQFSSILPDLKRGIQDILHNGNEEDKVTLNGIQLGKVRAQREYPEARFLSDHKSAAKTKQSSYTKCMVGSQFVPAVLEIGKDAKWRRFSSRELASLQGFPENVALCREIAYHMVGNAVVPPIIAMIAAAVLEYIGLGSGNKDIRDWGWGITKTLLLAASPDDSRREALEDKLSKVNRIEL